MKYSDTPIRVSNAVRHTPLFAGCNGQDGVICGDFLLRFYASGLCNVFSLREKQMLSSFYLDKIDLLKPHCNSVCFGAEKYCPDDEYPLLYSNIYNNYAGAEDRLEGVCCVYRLMRQGVEFFTTLVQVIRIGFVEDLSLWKSLPDRGDIRPYGNFVPDIDRKKLYAYVLRDREKATRYFTLPLPALTDGEYSQDWGVKVVTIPASAIESWFDAAPSFPQGACCYDGKLFSIAGGVGKIPGSANGPRLRVLDMVAGQEIASVDMFEMGLPMEPELIDFEGDTLYYMDGGGIVNILEFI